MPRRRQRQGTCVSTEPEPIDPADLAARAQHAADALERVHDALREGAGFDASLAVQALAHHASLHPLLAPRFAVLLDVLHAATPQTCPTDLLCEAIEALIDDLAAVLQQQPLTPTPDLDARLLDCLEALRTSQNAATPSEACEPPAASDSIGPAADTSTAETPAAETSPAETPAVEAMSLVSSPPADLAGDEPPSPEFQIETTVSVEPPLQHSAADEPVDPALTASPELTADDAILAHFPPTAEPSAALDQALESLNPNADAGNLEPVPPAPEAAGPDTTAPEVNAPEVAMPESPLVEAGADVASVSPDAPVPPEAPDSPEASSEASSPVAFVEAASPSTSALEPELAQTLDASTEAIATASEPQVIDPTQPQALEMTPEMMAALMAADSGGGWSTTPLSLPPEKAELLQFMVGDLTDSAAQIEPLLRDAFDVARRSEASETLSKLADTMAQTSSYFEFRSLNALVQLLREAGQRLPDVPESALPELLMRVRGIASLIQQHAAALAVSMETNWGLDTLISRTRTLLDGKPLDAAIAGWHKGDVERLLELDKVTEGIEPPPTEGGPPSGVDPGSWSPLPALQAQTADAASQSSGAPSPDAPRADDTGPVMRVECSAMDRLQDTIGQLVQNKNRLLRLPARMASAHIGAALLEDLTSVADQIDRLAGELQSTLLSARMQPLHRLFDRYPRIVRDVARINEREIELTVVGGETRVDKSAFDALGDPITFLMRFVASKSIETPAERQALGKPPTGHITLAAVNQGGQVTISVEDDGSGLSRERLLAPALASGLLSPEQAEAMPLDEVYALASGDDLPESPLAGLSTLVERQLGARLRISSTPGKGSVFTLVIPLKSAIIAAVMAQVGRGVYAIPLQAVTEIIRPEPEQRASIQGRECLRVRDHVFGVIDLHSALNEPADETTRPCAIMIRVGSDSAALLVDRIVGKQEIVIKPLERGDTGREGPFTGATIRDDGRVSLIIDVERLIHQSRADAEHEPQSTLAATADSDS